MAARKAKKPAPLISAENVGIRFRANRQRSMRARLRDQLAPGGNGGRGRDDFWALRKISFTIEKGEAVGLIGGNGHGKSTLLRLIAGVLMPDEGRIRVRARVSMLEVTGGFVGDLTVRQNIWLAAGLKGLSRRQTAARFDEIVEWAEIGHRLDTPFRHLSSGMKAKVGFAVTTSVHHPIVLLDEVLAVGDRVFKQKSFDRLEQMLGEDKTIVLVSHSERQIERFCERGIYLRKGRLIVDGPVQEALAKYAEDTTSGMDAGALARHERRLARRAARERAEQLEFSLENDQP